MNPTNDMRVFAAASCLAVACSADPPTELGATDGGSTSTQTTLDTLDTLPISAGPSSMGDIGDGDGDADGGDDDATGEDQPPIGERTAFVHLFEWPWASVARECEQVLGPVGYGAVQVSPPQEYPAAVQGSPWWDRYQPVSYTIAGRSGDRDAFADMVERCEAVGVDVYVDAVINHMAWSHQGVGIAGTAFTEYDYPPLFDPDHFHACRSSIQDYGNRAEVQTCELFGLPDLDTSQGYVQDQIIGYLDDLTGIGVAGFRIDAAKHIAADELATVLDGLAGAPLVFMEVIADDTIPASEYAPLGRVTEFGYGATLSDRVREGNLGALSNLGEGLLPSGQAVVFVDNHDNQRGHGNGQGVLNHASPAAYRLANAFMLAWPYGYPKVMSSFAFEDDSERPPLGEDDLLIPVHDDGGACRSPWVCEHRWPEMAEMVAFRNHCQGAEMTQWWSYTEEGPAVGFAREGCGYVAFNASSAAVQATVDTALPAGEYCNRISEDCDVPIVVASDGTTSLTIPAQGVVALDTRP